MKSVKIPVLILDDEPEIGREIREFLTGSSYRVNVVVTPSEAFRFLEKNPVEIALLDICLPEMSGLEVLRKIRQKYPSTEVIMMSGHGDMDSVIMSLRLGAVDFFKKPFLMQDMLETLDKTKKLIHTVRQSNGDHFRHVLDEDLGKGSASPLIAVSQAMQVVVDQMRLVARSSDTTVLITGESGTGKELIARGIHYLSSRSDKPFHAVNCSSVPDELFESEFFGYRKGAFTGALTDKAGWFEVAHQGSLFLDEIADMKPGLQAKLLRIMDDRQISRLGSTTLQAVDIRVIAATNQDIERLAREGQFRSDLYHRLNAFCIHVPPLRERREGIPHLLRHFVEWYSRKLNRDVPQLDPSIQDAMLRYDFPGNVRELKHMVERALILCQGDTLTFDHFDQLRIKLQATGAFPANGHAARRLCTTEKESIEAALAASGGNKSQAARMLGISRQALDRKIVKLGIRIQ